MAYRQYDQERLRFLISHALASGATRDSQVRFTWDMGGNCTLPFETMLYSNPDRELHVIREPIFDIDQNISDHIVTKIVEEKFVSVDGKTSQPYQLVLKTRCRKCESCRKARAFLWRTAAQAEFERWPRTWFGTLTLKPEARYLFLNKASARASAKSIDFSAQPEEVRFAQLHNAIAPELTKMIKRIRKVAPIRYLLVAEKHKSGDPHYHMLIHELDEGSIKHALLAEQWPHGFTKWKLAADKASAVYLCKYLSKSAAARVRASQAYGKAP